MQLPRAYRDDFASSFEIFNVQGIRAPAWWRDWSGIPGFNDDKAGDLLANHFFFVFFTFAATVVVYQLVVFLDKTTGVVRRLQILQKMSGGALTELPSDFKLPKIIGE